MKPTLAIIAAITLSIIVMGNAKADTSNNSIRIKISPGNRMENQISDDFLAVEILASGEKIDSRNLMSSRIVCGHKNGNYLYFNSTRKAYNIEVKDDCYKIVRFLYASPTNYLDLELSETGSTFFPSWGKVVKASKVEPIPTIVNF